MSQPAQYDGWVEVVALDAQYRQVQARVVEGVPVSTGASTRYRHRYGDCAMPEFSHAAKAAYLSRQSAIDAGVEQAVDQFRVNAFFQLLEHVMDGE